MFTREFLILIKTFQRLVTKIKCCIPTKSISERERGKMSEVANSNKI